MAATQLFNGTLGPHATTGPLTLALTPPFRGVLVMVSSATSQQSEGLTASYSFSIDNGITYSDPQMVAEIPGGSHSSAETILQAAVADHVQIIIQNGDEALPVASLLVTAEQFT